MKRLLIAIVYILWLILAAWLLMSFSAFRISPDHAPWLQPLPSFDALLVIISALLLAGTARIGFSPGLPIVLFLATMMLFVVRNVRLSHEQGNRGQVRLITLNVQQFRNDTLKVKKIIEWIQEENADIVCLQEFGLYYKWPDVASVSRDFSNRTGLPYYDFTPRFGNIFGTALFSRFPITSIDTLFQDAPDINEAKVYRLQLDHGELTVVNVHLASYNLRNKSHLSYNRIKHVVDKHTVQVQSILETVDKSAPVIICGDFNLAPGSHAYARLTSEFHDLQLHSGKGITPTHHYLPTRIDYIFSDDQLRLNRLDIEGDLPSDHKAIVASLSYLQFPVEN